MWNSTDILKMIASLLAIIQIVFDLALKFTIHTHLNIHTVCTARTSPQFHNLHNCVVMAIYWAGGQCRKLRMCGPTVASGAPQSDFCNLESHQKRCMQVCLCTLHPLEYDCCSQESCLWQVKQLSHWAPMAGPGRTSQHGIDLQRIHLFCSEMG